MKALHTSDLMQIAIDGAKALRADVLAGSTEYVTSVVVQETVMGPSGRRVPCGEARYPRCHADQFTTGWLTITSMDDGRELRTYGPGQWVECMVYGPDGHVAYGWQGEVQ